MHAPLPSDFLKLCVNFRLKLSPIEANGGVSVDGTVVENAQVPELKGSLTYSGLGPQNGVNYDYNK